MITLTTNIPVIYNINNLRKYEIKKVKDNSDSADPNISISLIIYGPNVDGKLNPYGSPITIYARQGGLCQILTVNANPSKFEDQLLIDEAILPGAYTTLLTALNSVAGRNAQRKAVEDVLVSSGLLSSQFVGT